MTVTLAPINGRKSFYGKCQVIDNGETLDLISYSTKVASYDKATDALTVNGWYSMTTSSHIDAFCQYLGKELLSKEEKQDCVSY